MTKVDKIQIDYQYFKLYFKYYLKDNDEIITIKGWVCKVKIQVSRDSKEMVGSVGSYICFSKK